MKNYSAYVILSLAILFNMLLPSLGEDIKFCPGSFSANGACANIDCGDLASFQWPASSMFHSCVCSDAGENKSTCTCQIVCGCCG
ncbi:hypothetical protein DM860_015757 [Cuscuta australis]|uniref:Uncharacterized protein n=2 Tax=Cuscuta sect. Cleistogrammica TaxID=1824901 RepID=A0A328DRT3_9ASTE|nr:hypothetical protein DM860_015757 [Cuscuta australis]